VGAIATLRTAGHTGPTIEPALANFLSGYGRYVYVPGPLLAAGLALGLAGMAGIGRARRSGLRAPCLLFTLGAIAAIEPPFVIATFDWRYELPQLSLIPIAAVLGVTALVGSRRDTAVGTSLANSDQRICPGQSTSSGKPTGTTGGTAVDVDPQAI
ncbi:MAG: hypothetical protein ACRDPF_30860, partial [Streptosporangiaceae bacterium]